MGVSRAIVQEDIAQRNPDTPLPKQGSLLDPVIKNGMMALSTAIDHPAADKKNGAQIPVLTQGGKSYYFLWSLERVGVAYGLKSIGGKDWYGFGAEILIANQREDGSWRGDFAACGADTCFALLFLKRVNLAKDLTATLQGHPATPPAPVPHEAAPPAITYDPHKPPNPSLEKPRPIDRTKPSEAPPVDVRPLPLALGSGTDSDAQGLATELVTSPPEHQMELLDKFRGSKGVAYTQALASAIPKLSDSLQPKAREALAEHMMALDAGKLRQCLHDSSPELRSASARALALKGDRSFIPDVVPFLDDRDVLVVKAAHAALKVLAGCDLGPANEGDHADCSRAAGAWKQWYSSH